MDGGLGKGRMYSVGSEGDGLTDGATAVWRIGDRETGSDRKTEGDLEEGQRDRLAQMEGRTNGWAEERASNGGIEMKG